MTTRGRPLIEFLGLDDPCPPSKLTSLLMCAYQAVSPQACEAMIVLMTRGTWRYAIRHGDAWIGRARSIVASKWYRETDDDVFVMVDADIVFTPEDIEQLVVECRERREIVCADYPSHNGQYLAGVDLGPPWQREGALVELRYAPSGCMAVHRCVLDALVPTLPLCHASLPIAYWPLFIAFTEQIDTDIVPLSEDFAFTARARALGFRAWRDTRLKIGHLSQFVVTADNMQALYVAGGERW